MPSSYANSYNQAARLKLDELFLSKIGPLWNCIFSYMLKVPTSDIPNKNRRSLYGQAVYTRNP